MPREAEDIPLLTLIAMALDIDAVTYPIESRHPLPQWGMKPNLIQRLQHLASPTI
jgi:hypothetical protein